MFILKQAILLCLLAASASAQACNRRLMESYDITGQDTNVTDPNSMCPGTAINCCTAQAQLDIYKRWTMLGALNRITSIYSTATAAYQNLFRAFSQIEQLAMKSIPYSTDIKNSNCRKMASRIHELSISSLQEKIQTKLTLATSFLSNARRGFYCALCDGGSHQYFNETSSALYTSGTFCAKLATAILPFYMFRYKHFPQITRLYSQWAVSCDIRGNFDPKAEIKASFKFYRQSDILGNLVSCFQGSTKQGAILSCKKLCKRFNPVKFDRYLEGDLDKINGLAKFLRRKLRRMQHRFQRHLSEMENIQNTVAAARKLVDKRVLDGTPSSHGAPAVEHLNEAISEVSYFNRKFKTGLVPPILYDFKNDFQIKFSQGLYESIFPLGTDPVVNVQTFHNVVRPTGIDFDQYGIITKIDYGSAQNAFIYLNGANSTVTLDQYLRSMK